MKSAWRPEIFCSPRVLPCDDCMYIHVANRVIFDSAVARLCCEEYQDVRPVVVEQSKFVSRSSTNLGSDSFKFGCSRVITVIALA